MSEDTHHSITFVCTSLFKGGAETQLVRLATGLRQRGWLVRIVTIMDLDDFGELLSSQGITVETLGIPRGRYDPRGLPALVRILRRHDPDVVCTFMYHANVLGRVAARLAGVRVVVSSIRNAVFGGRFADLMVRTTDGLANVTTTNSELAAEALLRRNVVKRDRLQVIRNAVDTAAAESGSRSRDELFGVPLGQSWLWLSVGRLEPQKAHDVTMRSLAQLVERGLDVRLAIAGTGGLHDELAQLRDALSLGDRVSFLQYRNDVKELMSAADGMVLASRWEGLPNSILEACIAELPVVATDVGGVKEIITDGESGFVVPPGDVEALSSAMARVMSLDPAELAAMTRAARSFVLDTFAPAPVIDRWESLFLEQIRCRARASALGSDGAR